MYSKEIISEDVFTSVKDKNTRDNNAERFDRILDDLRNRVKKDYSAFIIFLDILKDDTFNQHDLAEKIMSKYKGMID